MEQSEELNKAIKSVEKNNITDWVALITRGGSEAIPYLGGVIGEVISEFIPNQRQDRIVKLVKMLSEKMQEHDIDIIRAKLHDPYNIDIFEDASFQAVRALSEERLNYLTNALKHSLINEQLEYSHKKKMLWLLGQINDIEVIILFYYQKAVWGDQKEFFETHKNILFVPPVTHSSSQDEIDREILHNSYKNRLTQLGLLRISYHFVKKGEIPEFDPHTGKFKRGRLEITLLGRSLCDFIKNDVEK